MAAEHRPPGGQLRLPGLPHGCGSGSPGPRAHWTTRFIVLRSPGGRGAGDKCRLPHSLSQGDDWEPHLAFQASVETAQHCPQLPLSLPHPAILRGSGTRPHTLATRVSIVIALLRAGCHRGQCNWPGPGWGTVEAVPMAPCARRGARAGQGYSLLLGLVDAAPEVGDLWTTRTTYLAVRVGPGRPPPVAAGGPRAPLRRPDSSGWRTLSLSLRLVRLTYCWWRRALDTWARHTAAASPALTFLPEGDAGQGRGAGGGLQTEPLSQLSSVPHSQARSSCSLLLPRGGPGRSTALPHLPQGTEAGPRSHLAAGRREEVGAGGGGRPLSPPCPLPPTPTKTPKFCHARGSPCSAHHEPGPGGPATYNLASISTLARMFMIWKDQDGYGAGWVAELRRPPGALCGPCTGVSGSAW